MFGVFGCLAFLWEESLAFFETFFLLFDFFFAFCFWRLACVAFWGVWRFGVFGVLA